MFSPQGTQKEMGFKSTIMIICGDAFGIMKKKTKTTL